MTKEQIRYLFDIRNLDRIGLGMLEPGAWCKRPEHVRDLCEKKGWIRVEDENHPIGLPVCYLKTKGLRALKRACL